MNDAPSTPETSTQSEPVRAKHDETPREIAFRVLANAIKEVHFSDVRYRVMFRPVGLHGETFGARWDRVRKIVARRDRQAVATAWSAATKAGWTEQELGAAGLSQA
jgi:hypothetical protein